MRDRLKRWRRRCARWLRSLAGRIDPGWALPAQITTEHVMRYHELLIDVGLADAYDAGKEDVPSGGQDRNQAPPGGAPQGAAEAMRSAHSQAREGDGITVAQARKIRRAFVGEMERLNMIVLDISEPQAGDVPVDVTLQALRHFIPVYAAATSALIGTGGDTDQTSA